MCSIRIARGTDCTFPLTNVPFLMWLPLYFLITCTILSLFPCEYVKYFLFWIPRIYVSVYLLELKRYIVYPLHIKMEFKKKTCWKGENNSTLGGGACLIWERLHGGIYISVGSWWVRRVLEELTREVRLCFLMWLMQSVLGNG